MGIPAPALGLLMRQVWAQGPAPASFCSEALGRRELSGKDREAS